MYITKATVKQSRDAARLALLLWSNHTLEELEAEMALLIGSPEAALFLAYNCTSADSGEPMGFAQCQLRHDYVEGTDTSPVGYLEGIYVKPACRGMGLARTLLSHCEDWASEKGCRQFASDCELDNAGSLSFHLHAGFQEANRIICFVKDL